MSSTTQALVLTANGEPLELKTLEVASPGEHQVLVELHATGICHTDLTVASKHIPFPTPSIIGHEGAGIVKEVGSALTHKFSPGDCVILSFNFCGGCYSCTNGHPAYCTTFQKQNGPGFGSDGTPQYTLDGKPVFARFFGQSSFAKLALVEGNSVNKIPPVPVDELALLAPLGCGVQTGAGCTINTLQVRKGSSFAVFGAGAVGLSGLIAAKTAGADPIIAIDLNEDRLLLAKELGATHTISGSASDIVDQIRQITASTQGVMFAMDATGVVPVIENMVASLGIQGKGATVGVSKRGEKVSIEPITVMSMGKSYVGCIEGDCIPEKFIPYLIEEYRAKRLPLEKLVKQYPIADFQDAIRDMTKGTTVKPVLRWS